MRTFQLSGKQKLSSPSLNSPNRQTRAPVPPPRAQLPPFLPHSTRIPYRPLMHHSLVAPGYPGGTRLQQNKTRTHHHYGHRPVESLRHGQPHQTPLLPQLHQPQPQHPAVAQRVPPGARCMLTLKRRHILQTLHQNGRPSGFMHLPRPLQLLCFLIPPSRPPHPLLRRRFYRFSHQQKLQRCFCCPQHPGHESSPVD